MGLRLGLARPTPLRPGHRRRRRRRRVWRLRRQQSVSSGPEYFAERGQRWVSVARAK